MVDGEAILSEDTLDFSNSIAQISNALKVEQRMSELSDILQIENRIADLTNGLEFIFDGVSSFATRFDISTPSTTFVFAIPSA